MSSLSQFESAERVSAKINEAKRFPDTYLYVRARDAQMIPDVLKGRGYSFVTFFDKNNQVWQSNTSIIVFNPNVSAIYHTVLNGHGLGPLPPPPPQPVGGGGSGGRSNRSHGSGSGSGSGGLGFSAWDSKSSTGTHKTYGYDYDTYEHGGSARSNRNRDSHRGHDDYHSLLGRGDGDSWNINWQR